MSDRQIPSGSTAGYIAIFAAIVVISVIAVWVLP